MNSSSPTKKACAPGPGASGHGCCVTRGSCASTARSASAASREAARDNARCYRHDAYDRAAAAGNVVLASESMGIRNRRCGNVRRVLTQCLRIVLEPCDPHRPRQSTLIQERKTNHAAPSRAKSH